MAHIEVDADFAQKLCDASYRKTLAVHEIGRKIRCVDLYNKSWGRWLDKLGLRKRPTDDEIVAQYEQSGSVEAVLATGYSYRCCKAFDQQDTLKTLIQAVRGTENKIVIFDKDLEELMLDADDLKELQSPHGQEDR